MLVIGWFASKSASKGMLEHGLGGRSMHPLLIAFSYIASSTSASIYMGEPAMAYHIGWPAFWVTIAIIPGMVIPALLLTSRLRKYSLRLDTMTIPSYLGERYGSDAVRVILALVIVIFYTFPLMAQYKGASILFESILGIPSTVGLVLFTLIVGFYVAVGGFRAVVWTDAIQAIPMLIFSAVLIGVCYVWVGGLSGLNAQLQQIDPTLMGVFDAEVFTPAGVIGSYIFWFIVFISNPYLSIRFMAIRDTGKRSMGTFLIATLLMATLINSNYFIGLVGRVALPGLADADYATIQMAINFLPAFIAAFMMIGIVSAMMSTIDSILLVVGTAVSEDIYRRTINKAAPDKLVLLITRLTIIAVTLVVFGLSIAKPPEFLFIIMNIGLSGVGIAVASPLLVGLFWDKASKAGALASIVVGVCLYSYLILFTPTNFWVTVGIGAVTGLVVMIAVSAVTAPPSDEILDKLKS
jgi:SSS family transporter